MRREIRQLYYDPKCGCGRDQLHTLTLSGDEGIEDLSSDKLLKKALNNIYRRRGGSGEIDPYLFELNNRPLQAAIDKTFSAAGVDFGKRNEAFINQFKHNTSIFAAFKSHAEGEELAKLILNEKGDLRTFHEFEKLTRPIVGDYNKRWLKTEYDTVVRSSRMAANWKKFEERKHIFPNLEFMKSRAKDKRETHLEWVGTILPFEHPWWETHTPPIDWGCQCWIRQTRAKVTAAPDDGDSEVPEVFQNNPGVTGEFVAIDKHPYVTHASIDKESVVDFVNKNTPEKLEYVRQESAGSGGGYLDIHTLADKTPANKVIGETLADKGHKVKLLPDVPANKPDLRKKLIPEGVKPNKSPDALINSDIFEFKTIESQTYNAVSQELRKAGNQADNILINIPPEMDDTIINRAIRGRVKVKKNIREVWVMKGNKLMKYDRDYILGDQFGKSKAL